MKKTLIIASLAVVAWGTTGLMIGSNSPADPAQINWEKADKIMTQTYGANWYQNYLACVKDRARSKAMTATYQSAIGCHSAK